MSQRWILLLLSASMISFACGRNAPPEEGKWTRRPDLPPAVPVKKAMKVDRRLIERARKEIVDASKSADEITRAHGIEAMKQVYEPDYAMTIQRALFDRSRIVRKSAVLAAGELKLTDATGPLLRLVDDNDMQVRVATRFALHRFGDTSRSHDFELYVNDTDRSVRADTALVLGMLGEKSAVQVLRVLHHDHEAVVRLQAAEAMWRLGDEQALEDLIGATVSGYPDDQMIAYLALAGPRDPRVIEHIRAGLVNDYPEISLIAARAMGLLGSDAGYGVAIKGVKSKDPRQRALAALAFSAIGRADAQSYLDRLLKDGDREVRLAAAVAVLQLKSE